MGFNEKTDLPYFGLSGDENVGSLATYAQVRWGGTPRIWTFKTEDDEGTVNGTNYFLALIDALRLGDRIYVHQVTNRGAGNEARVDARWHEVSDLTASTVETATASGGGGGVTDHGLLTGRDGDDHLHYHNDARGDARYYTQSQVDSALTGKANTSHSHVGGDVVVTGTQNNAVAIGPGGVLVDSGTTPGGGAGGGNSVEVEGTAAMPSSIPAGGSVEVVVTGMTGVTNAAWVAHFIHVPSTNARIDRYAVITANDQVTVTLTNLGATEIAGLSGNLTVRARTLAGAPGLTGTAAMPASIPAGGSVEVAVTVTGLTTNYAVPFIHVPSTNAKIARYGVATAADTVTVTLTNIGATAITGLSGNITVKAESI